MYNFILHEKLLADSSVSTQLMGIIEVFVCVLFQLTKLSFTLKLQSSQEFS